MARVAVSHASEDLALACEAHRWLIETGHEAFFDQDLRNDIAVGEQWPNRLQERLCWAGWLPQQRRALSAEKISARLSRLPSLFIRSKMSRSTSVSSCITW